MNTRDAQWGADDDHHARFITESWVVKLAHKFHFYSRRKATIRAIQNDLRCTFKQFYFKAQKDHGIIGPVDVHCRSSMFLALRAAADQKITLLIGLDFFQVVITVLIFVIVLSMLAN